MDAETVPNIDRNLPRPTLRNQFGWLFTARAAGVLCQTGTIALFARWAGPESFGLSAAVLGAMPVLQALSDLGIAPGTMRMRAVDPGDGRVTTALRYNDRLSVLLALSLAIVLATAGFVVDPRCFQLVPLAIFCGLDKNAETWLLVALSDGRTREYAMSVTIRRAGWLGLFSASYAAGWPVLLAFSTSAMVAALAGQVWTRHRALRWLPSAAPLDVRQLLTLVWPFWVNSCAAQARQLDVILVGLMASATGAGLFGVASRLTSPLRLIPSSLALVILPHASRAGRNDAGRWGRRVVPLAAFLGLFYGVVALSAGPVVVVVLGVSYEGAILPLQVICGGLTFAGVSSYFNSVLQGLGAERVVAAISVGSTATCLCLVGVGAWLAGANGAAIALAASFVLQALTLTIAFGSHARTPRRSV